MDETARTASPSPPSLAAALRRVRAEAADQAQVVEQLRTAELARLEMLLEALQPVLAQVPARIDLFDAAIMPGHAPRLFIDVIAFVEMAHDKKTYRFLQDTRHGRVVVSESEDVDDMVATATDYIARRIVERERALASDRTVEDAARRLGVRPDAQPANDATPVAQPAGHAPADHAVEEPAPAFAPAPARRGLRGRLESAALFLMDFFGAAFFFLLLAALGWWLWTSLGAPPLPPVPGAG